MLRPLRRCLWILLCGSALSAPATGVPFPGPDEFGYTAAEVAPTLRDIRSTGFPVVLGDDQLSAPLPLPFPFEFYGVVYTSLRVSSNGFIALGSGFQSSGCCSGSPIPRSFSPNNVIAAWWEDFNPPLGGTIRAEMLGSAGSREVVIGYYDVPHYLDGVTVTWEIVLHEGTNAIEIQCWDCATDGGTHSIGIEDASGTIGLEIARQQSPMPRTGWILAQNDPPDCTDAEADPAEIWPPDEKFVDVSVTGVSDPEGGPVTVTIDGVFQDEAVEGGMSSDAWGSGSDIAHVRAERSGPGDGRVYHVEFTARDELGSVCTGEVTVCVPRGRRAECVDQGPLYDSSHPPSLDSSEPLAGSVGVPRTAWILLSLSQALRGPESVGIACDGRRVERRLSMLDARTVIVNPTPELPPGADCRVRWTSSQGPQEMRFVTAAGSGSTPLPYDRRIPTLLTPFPDDYWLVDDPGTPSGKRIQLEISDLGDALLTSAARAISTAISDRDGYSPIQSFVIQLPEPLDAAALPQDEFASIDPLSTIALFDMDPASPSYGSRVPFTFTARNDAAPGGGREDIGVLFPATRLAPGGTYALAVTRRVHAVGDPGRPLGPSTFFEAVARPPMPGEAPEVSRARESIGPVLDFLDRVPGVPVPREDLALALRISIRSEAFDPSDLVAMKEAVLAAPPPALDVQSVEPIFGRGALIRGTVDLPFYLVPGDLSQIQRDPATGRPVPSSFDSVPFVLTLPDVAHDGPVPIVMYQHGTPGSPEEILFPFNEFLDDAGYAIGGIHDPLNRRFVNIEDQQAASFLHLLVNSSLPLFQLQSYADMQGFLRALQGVGGRSWLPLGAPDAVPEIAPTQVLFRGISRGSIDSLAFLPLAPEVTAAVSVVGGGREWESSIHQFVPENFAFLLPTASPSIVLIGFAALVNESGEDSEFLATHLYRDPLAVSGQSDIVPPSLLWLEGIGDTLVSNNETRAAAEQLGIPLLRPLAQASPVLVEADTPLSENVAPGVTGGHFQYDPFATPSCRDLFFEFEGHFCPQIALEAELQTLHFFETALDPSRAAEIINPFAVPVPLAPATLQAPRKPGVDFAR